MTDLRERKERKNSKKCSFEDHRPNLRTAMGSLEQAPEDASSTISLANSPLFRPKKSSTREDAFRLSYERAVAINKHYSQ